jgi:glyoxylase-like metal-dependent hydrolase (beta-lactamase superfamily II)
MYRHFIWEDVGNGIWFGKAHPDSFQSGNTVIIALPSGGSLVVDPQVAPFIGEEIVAKAKELNVAPVKYVVDTHLHQDHCGGNAAFKRAYPGVKIIAHKHTCATIPLKTIPRMKSRLKGQQAQLTDFKQRRAAIAATDPQASALDLKIQGLRLYLEEAEHFDWVLPDTSLDLKPGETHVINDGQRRIEIGYFGRAHTDGALVVFLPNEKVLASGDIWLEKTGFMMLDAGLDGRDGSVIETPVTQNAIRALDFDIALPGHDDIHHGKAALDAAIANSTNFVGQIKTAYAYGEEIETILNGIQPPPDTSPFLQAWWRRTVIRGFEELELRRQLGLPDV